MVRKPGLAGRVMEGLHEALDHAKPHSPSAPQAAQEPTQPDLTAADFRIGTEFYCGGRKWRCTDVGTRVVVAIRIDGVDPVTLEKGRQTQDHLDGPTAEAQGWFSGPPYKVAEHVFDEHDLEGCSFEPD